MAERKVSAATIRARQMMMGGVVMGHVVGFTVIGLALAMGGPGAALTASFTPLFHAPFTPLQFAAIIPFSGPMAREAEALVRRAVEKCLTEQERQVIRLRYGLEGEEPLRQRQVAERTGISRSYVSRIEKRALEKLRAELEA